jgi:hypothetical protein
MPFFYIKKPNINVWQKKKSQKTAMTAERMNA